MDAYIDQDNFIEHSPDYSDDRSKFHAVIADVSDNNKNMKYEICHRLLSEGNFVLSVCEGTVDSMPTAFFDLCRLEAGKIVEHWDTTETIPPRSEWRNNIGKF